MRVLVLNPDDSVEFREIPNELRALQEAVGGYIETAPTNFLYAKIVVDEDGKAKGKTYNHNATCLLRADLETNGDTIVGTALVVGIENHAHGAEFEDVPPVIANLYPDAA